MKPNRELVVYCLYLAGGATERVHTEDLALKCWELFPDSFSWTKYPRYADKDIVRVALTDARKEKYGALVAGRVEGKTPGTGHEELEGWLLTDKGLAWITKNLESFNSLGPQHERKTHRQLLLKRARKVMSSGLFLQFVESGPSFSPTIGELAAFFQCRVDASDVVWERRLADIRRLGIDAREDSIGRFAAACSDAYQRER